MLILSKYRIKNKMRIITSFINTEGKNQQNTVLEISAVSCNLLIEPAIYHFIRKHIICAPNHVVLGKLSMVICRNVIWYHCNSYEHKIWPCILSKPPLSYCQKFAFKFYFIFASRVLKLIMHELSISIYSSGYHIVPKLRNKAELIYI